MIWIFQLQKIDKFSISVEQTAPHLFIGQFSNSQHVVVSSSNICYIRNRRGGCLCHILWLFFGSRFRKSFFASLLTVCICARVVVSVTFQQVNDAPDTEASAKGDDEGLKNIDSRVKEIHKCVCRNMRDIGLGTGSHNASAGTKTAVRLPIPASPFNF